MNRREAQAWVARFHGPRSSRVLPGLAEQLDALASASSGGPFLIDYFEGTLGSSELFGRVKVVHVTRFLTQASGLERRSFAARRRAALEGLFERWGLDARSLRRMYDAVFGSGLRDFYPVASVEWDLASGRFAEVSLYTEESAPHAARAMARGLGIRGAEGLGLGRLFAVGYDFRPGKPSRFKLYHRHPLSARALSASASGRRFLAIPPRHRPCEYLVLQRYTEGKSAPEPERTDKVYLSYLQRESAATACTPGSLARASRPGPLKDFLLAIAPAGEGQYLDYLGCEADKFEAYFGRPAWGFLPDEEPRPVFPSAPSRSPFMPGEERNPW